MTPVIAERPCKHPSEQDLPRAGRPMVAPASYWSCPDHGRDTRKRHVPARRHRPALAKTGRQVGGTQAADAFGTPARRPLQDTDCSAPGARRCSGDRRCEPPCGLDGLPATAGCRRPGTRSSGAFTARLPCRPAADRCLRPPGFVRMWEASTQVHDQSTSSAAGISPAEGGATHRKTPASCHQRRRRQQVCRWRRAPAPAAEVIADVVVQHVQIPPQDSP